MHSSLNKYLLLAAIAAPLAFSTPTGTPQAEEAAELQNRSFIRVYPDYGSLTYYNSKGVPTKTSVLTAPLNPEQTLGILSVAVKTRILHNGVLIGRSENEKPDVDAIVDEDSNGHIFSISTSAEVPSQATSYVAPGATHSQQTSATATPQA